MLSLRPSLIAPNIENDALCEMIFVIDRSGSMAGGFIKRAGETLILCVSSLPVGCKVNIIGFGSSFQQLYPASRVFNDSVKQTLTQHASNLQVRIYILKIFLLYVILLRILNVNMKCKS